MEMDGDSWGGGLGGSGAAASVFGPPAGCSGAFSSTEGVSTLGAVPRAFGTATVLIAGPGRSDTVRTRSAWGSGGGGGANSMVQKMAIKRAAWRPMET